jgi:GTP-binding protein YchF
MLQAGIVGMPNVGKSTLFNALTSSYKAESANYPFCTIEPNTGIVKVSDARLFVLQELVKTEKVIPAVFEFVDIAGLVKGASKGEGRGNKFLASIREVDTIVHVVRCFDDPNIVHVEGSVDPLRDLETIHVELCLADMESLGKRIEKLRKQTRSGDGDPASAADLKLFEKLLPTIEAGDTVNRALFSADEHLLMKRSQLMAVKPVIYAANLDEGDLANPQGNANYAKLAARAKSEGREVVPISAQIESELSQLSAEEQSEYLQSLGVTSSGVDRLIRAAFTTLGLDSYFTAGVKEVRAWPFSRGWTAPQCAGVIHSDFEKGFIRAEVIAYDEYVACSGEKGAKEKGSMRLEGKEYLMHDGDVVHFRVNN